MEIKKVQLNVYIAEIYRDLLQKMAAERMMKDPRRSVTASKVGAEIIGEYLEKIQGERSNKR